MCAIADCLVKEGFLSAERTCKISSCATFTMIAVYNHTLVIYLGNCGVNECIAVKHARGSSQSLMAGPEDCISRLPNASLLCATFLHVSV